MELTATRVINLETDQVFAFLADASNNPLWQKGMISCRWTTDPPIRVGSIYEQTARFAGRAIESTFEVSEFVPGHSIRIETIESTFPIQVKRSVEAIAPSSCRVQATITGGPESGILRWLEPLMARKAQRSVDDDYDRLVQVLEARTASTEDSPSE